MQQIKVIIELSEYACYWAYSQTDGDGITGVGDTIEEVKKSVFECIEIQKELGNFTAKDYEVIFIIEK